MNDREHSVDRPEKVWKINQFCLDCGHILMMHNVFLIDKETVDEQEDHKLLLFCEHETCVDDSRPCLEGITELYLADVVE